VEGRPAVVLNERDYGAAIDAELGMRKRRKLGRWEDGKVGKKARVETGGKRAESSKLKAERRGDWVRPDTGHLMPDAGWREAEIPRQRGCRMPGTEKNGGWERGGDKKMNIQHRTSNIEL